MGLQACRIFDRCSGHQCFPSRPCNQGSPDTFFNSRQAHRQGDSWLVHCCGGCHPSNLASGSQTVFVNGRQQGRITDPVACGSRVASGSPDCFIG
jgi:uncharacterized Zn-binding protein involved in type VI secretion